MSAWVHGRGLVRWQWSSMASRAYSAIRSRLRPSSSRAAAAEAAGEHKLGERDQVPGRIAAAPQPSRAARSAHARPAASRLNRRACGSRIALSVPWWTRPSDPARATASARPRAPCGS